MVPKVKTEKSESPVKMEKKKESVRDFEEECVPQSYYCLPSLFLTYTSQGPIPA